ncbi:MAG: metallopeptidase family protein [Kineosporiaceae bacterium]|nr:metallopeptidase family protein [Kineosporiaceae bacterium]
MPDHRPDHRPDQRPEDRPAPPGAGVRRHRDRHGRGHRGPVLPRGVPAWKSRKDRFDSAVLDAVEQLERTWPSELDGIEFAVEDVPPSDPAPWEHGAVPLGRSFPAHADLPHRVVIYRRPVESRTGDGVELPALVHDVVVEQVAHLLGRRPEEIDPRYGGS